MHARELEDRIASARGVDEDHSEVHLNDEDTISNGTDPALPGRSGQDRTHEAVMGNNAEPMHPPDLARMGNNV
ncbi:unnamed protein product [Phytophthora lilii]|uniref:Unnamed protein product n=1 Tax=Phytophthora lilii TaxID=2077276 RepID=A0A9W6WIN3_9STRA|nr:unnamed protein product [Phytophthora lilii]